MVYRALKSRFGRAIAQLSYLPQTFRLIWAASHVWTLVWLGLLLVQGLLPGAIVYLTRLLVDGLVSAIGAGISWTGIQPVLMPVSWIVGLLLVMELSRGAIEWVRTLQSELVQDYMSGLVHQKSIEVDLAFYESSDYYDHLNRARSDASGRSLALLENSGGLLQNGITLITMVALLLPYGLWLPLVLLGSTLPAFYVLIRLNRRQHDWWQRRTTDRRWLQYYELLLTQGPVAAELRLFNLGPYFKTAYQSLRARLRAEQMAIVKEQSLTRLGAAAIGLLISGVAIAWVGRQVLAGAMTLGDLALFYQAFNKGQGMMRSLLSNLGQIYNNSLFLGNLFEFLQLQPQVIDPAQPQPIPQFFKQGIRFRQVTFRYPGSTHPVLQDFDLWLPAGKVVAIVGDNGAGKSTLIKLLCRFYDPEAGCIEIDGVDIRDFAVAELRCLMTVLFQAHIPYYVTAAQNIALGDLSAQPTRAEIEAAAQGAGIHEAISRLPQGYDSMLGKWFPGGSELSGGEWQRLALSRSFLRRAQLIILDEPTSSMDPWAEFDWLERFRALANGRTALIITHRFTLAMRADVIHVMRAGQIVETGTHDELLAQTGLYAQSWQNQYKKLESASQR